MKIMRVLCCENEKCNSTFGGSNGFGNWSDGDIRDEAIDVVGWVMLRVLIDEHMFCSYKCLAQWIKDHQQ